MKRTTIWCVAAIMLLSFCLLASVTEDKEQKVSEKEVPEKVLAAFRAAYPNAVDIAYTRETENEQPVYEIAFKDSDKDFEVDYAADGTLLEQAEAIGAADLPEAVLNQLKSEFKSYEIEEAEKIIKNKQAFYELEVEVTENGRETDHELLFDATGKIVEHEMDKEEEDE